MTIKTETARAAAALAEHQAGSAALRSEAVIETPSDPSELEAVAGLWERIWGNTGSPIVGFAMLRALAHAGNYVSAAYDRRTGALLGASMGFFGEPAGELLHSDITGIVATARHRKLGFALKLHQRAWALSRGIDEITWTFDPLVARNAYFNIQKLRADIARYYVDFYGDLDDDINTGQGSDRLLASWHLTSPEVVAACGGSSVGDEPTAPYAWLVQDVDGPVTRTPPADCRTVLVAVPDDVEALRTEDPVLARTWRTAVRDTLGAELRAGARVIGFDRAGAYRVRRPHQLGEESSR